jgi:hypothetical protein
VRTLSPNEAANENDLVAHVGATYLYGCGRRGIASGCGHAPAGLGTATVAGLGAGPGRPFTARVTAGGPVATVLVTVSGLSFHEILTDGHFDVS